MRKKRLKDRILAGFLGLSLAIGTVLSAPVTALAAPTIFTSDRPVNGDDDFIAYINGVNIQTGSVFGVNCSFHEADGIVSFCIQENKGNPYGDGYTEDASLNGSFTLEQRNAVRRVIENGYLSYPYWNRKYPGILEDSIRFATQYALWYTLDVLGQPDNQNTWVRSVLDEKAGEYTRFVENTSSTATNGTLSILKRLCDVGVNGGYVTTPTIDVVQQGDTVLSGDSFVATYKIHVNDMNGGYSCTITGLPSGSTAKLNGTEVNTSGYTASSMQQGTDTLVLTIPVLGNSGKNITITANGKDNRNEANFHYYVPTSNGNLQCMAKVDKVILPRDDDEKVLSLPTATGRLELVKKDEATGAALAGAVYGVYADAACTQLVQTFPATGADGKATLTGLARNTYYIKEITAAPNHALSSQVYIATLSGGSVRVDVTDPAQKVKLVLTKYRDGTTTPVSGAGYAIYRDAACTNKVADLADHGNGTYSASGLSQGTYYIKETKAPAGYVLSTAVIPVTLSGDNSGTAEVRRTLTTTDSLQTIRVKLTKTDSGTGAALSGAEFAIYRDAACTNRVYTLEDKGNGIYEAAGIPQGTYYLKEVKAPDGYSYDGTVNTITLTGDSTGATEVLYTVSRENTPQTVKVVVTKKDSGTGAPLKGAEFVIYSDAACTNKVSDLEDQGDGTYSASGLSQGTYYLKEVKAPAGYVYDGTVTEVVLSGDSSGNAEVTAAFERRNRPQEVIIRLVKEDADTAEAQGEATLDGAVYGIYAAEDIYTPDGTAVKYRANQLVKEMTTENGGKAQATGLVCGKYYLKEHIPSTGYLLDPTIYSIDVTASKENQEAQIVKVQTVKEQVIARPFQLIKVSHNGETNMPFLKGAGFAAYPKATLLYLTDGKIDYAASPKAAIGEHGETELFTDENGYLQSIALPYGTYIIHESTVPADHFAASDFTVKISEEDCVLNEDGICVSVKDGPKLWRVIEDEEFNALIRIFKKDAVTGQTVALAGAVFRIYDLQKNEYVVMHEIRDGRKYTVDTFVTTEDGTVYTPEVLHPGHYRLEEVTAPDGYYNEETAEGASGIEFRIGTGMAMEEEDWSDIWDADLECYVVSLEYWNTPVTGEIELVKQGEVLTGFEEGKFIWETREIPGAVYEIRVLEDIYTPDNQGTIYEKAGIRYTAGTVIATVTTDSDGKAKITGLPLGKYEIREVSAPEGFLLNSETVKYATLSYEGQNVLVVRDSDGDPENAFFNKRPKAVPDEPEKPVDPDEPGTPPVDPGMPDEPDEPYIPDEGEEIILGIGMFKFSRNEDGETDFHKPLSGAVFQLFNRYDIYSVDGVLLVPADTCLGTAVTGESGLAVFHNDFPTNIYIPDADPEAAASDPSASEFYAVETAAPDGYILNPDQVDGIRFHYLGEEMSEYTLVNGFQDNDYTKVEISKTSMVQDCPEVPGATLQVVTKQDITWNGKEYRAGEVIEEFVSTAEPHRMNALSVGAYELTELRAPFGFVVAETVSFTVEDTGEIQKVSMDDREAVAKLILHKIDAGNGKSLAGVKFLLTNTKTGDTWELVTDEEGYAESPEVPFAVFQNGIYAEQMVYTLVETETIPGYILDETVHQISFEYADDKTPVIELPYEISNDYTKVEISKTSMVQDCPEVPGATLQVVTKQDITWNGKEYRAGEVIEEFVSTAEPHRMNALPVGAYELTELRAPFGFVVAETVSFTVKDTGEIQKVSMVDAEAYGKVTVKKTDEETGEPLAGVKFEVRYSEDILDAEGRLVHAKGDVADVLVTGKDGTATSKELPIGTYQSDGWNAYITYTIVEVEASEGYVPDDTAYEFTFTYVDDRTPVVEETIAITNKKMEIPNLGISGPQKEAGNTELLWLTLSIVIAGLALLLIAARKIHNKKA